MTRSPRAAARQDAILDACDALLGEVGRRQHRFAWLRAPQHSEDWLPVASYYPGRRLVLALDPEPVERALLSALVPEHGLRLVIVASGAVGADPGMFTERLQAALAEQGFDRDAPPPEPAPVSSPSPELAPRSAVQGHSHRSRTPPSPTGVELSGSGPEAATRTGIVLGLALVALTTLEAWLGLVVVALQAGDGVLGIGILLDAAARAGGVIAAGARGEPDRAWLRLLGGSVTLAGEHATPDREPDPVLPARVVARLALGLIALGLVLAL
jgi:hypothetical protein